MAKTSKKTITPHGLMKFKGKSNVSHTAKPGRAVPQGPTARAQSKGKS